MRKVILLVGALVMSLVLIIAGCSGGGSSGGSGSGPTVNTAVDPTIEVYPAGFTLPPGVSLQFTATLIPPVGNKQGITDSVTWSSSAPGVATVSSTGVVTAVAAGSAKITASNGGVSGSANVTVAALSTITISNFEATMPAGINQQLKATGAFSDGSSEDLTSLVTWNSSNTAVATVSNGADRKGWVSSLAPGATAISATLAGVTGTVGLTVTTATLSSLVIDQGSFTLPIGVVRTVTATGTFSDGSTHDVTSAASWTSSAPGVATVSGTAGSSGRVAVTAVAKGEATIAAVLANKGGSITVTVSDVTLKSLQVVPATPTVGLGIETVQFTAIGTFSDDSKQDVTDTVEWSSSRKDFVDVSTETVPGLATPVAVGTSTITAKTTMTSEMSASADMTVTSPEPTIVSVSPNFGPVGQEVHVRGTNFIKDQTTVTLKDPHGTDIPASTVLRASTSFLTFQVPAGITSSVVTITTPKGSITSTGTNTFTVGEPTAAPTVSSMSPTLGPVGQTVTVFGTNFISPAADGTIRTFVTIGGQKVPATVLEVDTLTFTVPSNATSPSTISVATTIGAADSTASFTIGTPSGAPTIDHLDYNYGPPGAYRIVTGSNFVIGNTTINLGGVTGITATVYNPTTLSFIVPDMLGNTKVTVITPNGSAPSPDIFVKTSR